MSYLTKSIGFSLNGPKEELTVSLSTGASFTEMTIRIAVTGLGTKYPVLSKKISVREWQITLDVGETRSFDNVEPGIYVLFRMTKFN